MGAFDLSPGTLFAGLVVSGIGFALFQYGKSESHFPRIFAGLAMMALPMFVHGALMNLGVGAVVLGALWAVDRWA